MIRLMLLLVLLPSFCLADLHIDKLTCEYSINPVGVDCDHPRLSWIMRSKDTCQYQKAYQVIVASDMKLLKEGKADIWDSDKVCSDQSVNVLYSGKKLNSLNKYYWKVRVWDNNDKVSSWSKAGQWVTGLVDNDNFKGDWISYSKPIQHEAYDASDVIVLDNAKWIWYPTDSPIDEFEALKLKYIRKINLGDVSQLESACIGLTADDSCQLCVNGLIVDSNSSWSIVKKYNLMTYLKSGENVIEINTDNSAKGAGGLICKLIWKFNGTSNEIVSDKNWQVCKQSSNDIVRAKEIANFGDGPWGRLVVEGQDSFYTQKTPSPLLRKEFSIRKKIKSAYSVISGLGFYELRINGKKVGDKVLDPVLTNYEKTVLYSTYDIKNHLKKGANAVGIMLGNGWYNSHTKAAWNYDTAPWRDEPKVLMNIVINYTDGTSEMVCTDNSWFGSNGPLVADAIRNGEVYDARLEQPGWDCPNFGSRSWENAAIAKAPNGKLRSEIMPATKVHKTIAPVKITELEQNVYLVDIGVNISGWALLTLKGEPGQKITLRYGEKLKDGKLDNDSIRGLTYSGPFQTDTYYLKGDGVEQWNPRFVYHGFRYIEVTGLKDKPTKDTIKAQMVYTDFKTLGTFECSNELFNTIQEITDRSYKSNYVGIPTDCPQREKNGWTADAHLAAELAMMNYENTASYEKWLADFRDDQDSIGRYSCIIPSPGWGARDLTEWDSAYMITAWYLYLYRNDIKVVQDNYDNMKRYIENVVNRIGSSYIVTFGLGDWANDSGNNPSVPLTATAYFYYDTVIMKHFADILGKDEDVRYFTELSNKVRSAYNNEFYKGDGIYEQGQQSSLVLSLFYNLVTDSERPAVENKLIEKIKADNYHHDVGILGAKCIFRYLSDMGRTDIAMKLLNQKTKPSYGYWIENGATSLYENWTKDPGSMNHIMYGDISGWFFSYLGGIQATSAKPGFKNTIIHPRFAKDIDWVKTDFDSPYGNIEVNWQRNESGIICSVKVPVNTEAVVIIDSCQPDVISCNQSVITKKCSSNSAVYTVGSGSYTFSNIKE